MSYLTISNQGPQIQLSHIIKDHPRWTAIAEAVRNMLQASTALCPIEPVELKIRKLDLNGLIELEHPDGSIINRFKNKLSFLNPGGMTAKELEQAFCYLGSSVNKVNSLDKSFGQGIRTATLFWTDLLCVTYKPEFGAHYVWLGKEQQAGNDFQITIKSKQGSDYVVECTDWVRQNAQHREYNLEQEFTEVILLGKDANPIQDTFLDPYGDGKRHPDGLLWIRKAIFTRFWKLPTNVSIQMHLNVLGDTTAKNTRGYKPFMTFLDCLNYDVPKAKEKPVQQSIRSVNTGAVIHYYYDCPMTEDPTGEEGYVKGGHYSQFKGNDNGHSTNISGILLDNELYDVLDNGAHEQSVLIKLGVQQHFRNFKVVYELPHNAGYTYDMYRTTVMDGQKEISFDNQNILEDIVLTAPSWWNDLVKQTKLKSIKDLNAEIQRRLAQHKSLMNAFHGLTSAGSGAMQGQKANNGGGKINPHNNKKRPYVPKNYQGNKPGQPVPPEIVDNEEITNPYFAKVEGTQNAPIIFVNPNWKTLEILASHLDIDQDRGKWYVRAKQLLKDEFTISAVIWYLNALNENLRENISVDEYNETIKAKSINMYLMAIQTSVVDLVRDQIHEEHRKDAKEIKHDREVNPDVLTNGANALTTKAKAEFGDKYKAPITDVLTNGANALTTKAKAEFGDKYKAPNQ